MTEAAKEPHCGHPKHVSCACGHTGGDWTNDFANTPNAAVKDHCVAIRTLLSELFNTVGAVLTARPKHVWQVYGGFQRIYEATKNIFYHGCKHTDAQGNADIWPFVVGLRVLSPVLGPYVEASSVSKPADEWIRTSLQKLQLAAKVAALTIDIEYVKKHYQPWSLLCSAAHTGAVIKCLQALEENSQDLLADIDPKLLVGTQWISSSTASETSNSRPSGLPKHLLTGLLLENRYESRGQRNTLSLPTSPITDRNWAPVWPSQNDETKKKGVFEKCPQNAKTPSKVPTDSIIIKKNCGRRLFVNDDMGPLRRGKSEASIKCFSSGLSNPWEQLARSDDLDEHNISLMSRESPDGSSGSSDWPPTSPVTQPSSFIGKDISNVYGTTSHSTISKLVQGKSPIERMSGSGTGARPKDLPSTQPLVTQQFQDISDSGSGPRSNISPSLLKVEYGGDNTTSEGEASSQYSLCNQRTGLGFRTPQLRRRASSWRMMSVPVDSDQDSEDTADGSLPQASRRRRRLTPSQQRSGLSVKLLVDSRGVLVGDGTSLNDKKVSSQGTEQKALGSDVLLKEEGESKHKLLPHSSSDSPSEPISQTSAVSEPVKTPPVPVQVDNVIPHPKSTPVSTTLAPDVVDGIAFSAPGRVSKTGHMESSEMVKTKKKTHGRSRSDGAQELVGKLRLSSSNTAPTLESELPGKMSGSKENITSVLQNPVRKRFMEDGGQSIAPAADYGFFPRPQPGQSLIGFLSSKEFHKPYAELDRENAHFNISEAVIAALTQMQFDKWQREVSTSPITAEDSDEEIRNLQARIREKRRQKLTGSISRASTINTIPESTSDPQRWVRSLPIKIESTTDYSVCESPQSSTYNSESDLLSDFEEEDHNGSFSGEEPTLSRKTSMSDSTIFKGDLTAENVALNLLKHFNEQKLPKASELEWLVSEQEVPQKLLPLPTSVAVSPDDNGAAKDSQQSQTQLRGTSEWAPPRPQLILTLHSNTKRSALMETQGWRCAGCGMRVPERLSRHFRLCHYLGRYFCTTCHSNQTAIIPAKVLHKWDFKPYPVASFSSELLERMRSDPLFNVGALNPRLYKRCRHLHQTHIYRLQLYYTLSYINTCSRAQSERAMLGKLPPHWANDPHVYSIDDLVAIKAGELVADIKEVTSISINHIAKCQVCLGRGFICEVCGHGEAIFPFQLDSTALCECCNACFHAGCFSPARCPRCIRRESRRSSREVIEREKEDSTDSSSSKES